MLFTRRNHSLQQIGPLDMFPLQSTTSFHQNHHILTWKFSALWSFSWKYDCELGATDHHPRTARKSFQTGHHESSCDYWKLIKFFWYIDVLVDILERWRVGARWRVFLFFFPFRTAFSIPGKDIWYCFFEEGRGSDNLSTLVKLNLKNIWGRVGVGMEPLVIGHQSHFEYMRSSGDTKLNVFHLQCLSFIRPAAITNILLLLLAE